MDLKINGKDYQLQFGLKFINQLDNIYTQEVDKVKFGMGVEMMTSYLAMRNPLVLLNIIKAGTSHLNSKPSNNDIENLLEEHANGGTLEKLFKDVTEAMENAPFLKNKMKRAKQEAKKNQ